MLFLFTLRTLHSKDISPLHLSWTYFSYGFFVGFFPWRPKAAIGLCSCCGTLVIGDRRIVKSHQRPWSGHILWV